MTGDPLVVRAARLEDVSEIIRIEKGSFGDPWSASSFRSLIQSSHGYARVALRGGTLVGYCIAWRVGEEAELANLAADPDARRQGIGGRLLDDLLAMVDTPPPAAVFLEVRASNEAAQALYRSRGFVAAGRRRRYYSRPDEDAVVMRRAPKPRG